MTIDQIEAALQNADVSLENRREHLLALIGIVKELQIAVYALELDQTPSLQEQYGPSPSRCTCPGVCWNQDDGRV